MGAQGSEVLVKYLVVITVQTGAKGGTRYFKDCTSHEGILNAVSNLKDNESVARIFSVNEFGVTVEHTVQFINGRLAVVQPQGGNE